MSSGAIALAIGELMSDKGQGHADWQDAKALIASALDALGLALANHGHQWTDAERDLYERAIAVCQTEEFT